MPINRQALVSRHNPALAAFDPLSPLSVGNGNFAFSTDITGLQTFPDLYAGPEAIPLCTQSTWGWHTTPPPATFTPATTTPATKDPEDHSPPPPPDAAPVKPSSTQHWQGPLPDLRLQQFSLHGHTLPLATSNKGQEPLFNYLRENPHRLHLGRFALELLKADGSLAKLSDLTDIHQSLDLWTGVITSRFSFEGVPVTVQTTSTGDTDGMAFRINSPLLAQGHIHLLIAFPYGSPSTVAADWSSPTAHTTKLTSTPGGATLTRQLDETTYTVSLLHSATAKLSPRAPHEFILSTTEESLELTAVFHPPTTNNGQPTTPPPTFETAQRQSAFFWQSYWGSGGAISLEGSTDPRAHELERRMVLSQYLLRINCASALPPQETGLTYNTWYGKFHLEMHWWHAVHFALWNRLDLFERSMGYYHDILPAARDLAKTQGFKGARWPKMTDYTGRDSPSPVGPLLIWQQPHPIFYAELIYRQKPTPETLARWSDIVEETADFMADFAFLDPATGKYVLGPPLKTVSENTNAGSTQNPAFELAYWHQALTWAQTWRERQNKPRDAKWDDVLAKLSPLPKHPTEDLYLLQDNTPDTYTTWNWEHPAIMGVSGFLNGTYANPTTMKNTVEKIMSVWQWERCWGWDFPLSALAAARNGRPDLAIDALLIPAKKNFYSAAGHNYQRPSLTSYFPGNGGLLTALALMAKGWDGNTQETPGFPPGFKVQHESLLNMP